MKKYILALLVSGCGGIPMPPMPTMPPLCMAQHDWNGYHLGHDAMSPSVTNTSGYELDLNAWNALGTPITMLDGGGGFPIEVVEGGNASSGWLGIASVKLDSDLHIVSALVQMNRTLLNRHGPNAAKHVLCQEIGHILGLDHQYASDSCMDDCSRSGNGRACLDNPEATTPNAHDAEQLRTIYSHVGESMPPLPPPPMCLGDSASNITIHIFR